MSKPIILLIGGNGFLGRHLACALVQDWSVRVFDRPGEEYQGPGEFFPGDIANQPELEVALRDCAAMIYLVHETGNSPYSDSDRLSLIRNLELFLMTLESSIRAGVRKVILFSSGGAVYGIPETQSVTEDHPVRPISTYGVAKAAMENYLRVAGIRHGLSYLLIRPSNPYGPGHRFNKKQGVIPIFIKQILKNQKIEIWGDGTAVKDYIYVGDMAKAVTHLIERGFDNRAYNIGSGVGVSLLELVSLIETVLNKKADIVFSPSNKHDVSRIILDVNLIHKHTGWKCETSLEEGIRMTADWIASNVLRIV